MHIHKNTPNKNHGQCFRYLNKMALRLNDCSFSSKSKIIDESFMNGLCLCYRYFRTRIFNYGIKKCKYKISLIHSTISLGITPRINVKWIMTRILIYFLPFIKLCTYNLVNFYKIPFLKNLNANTSKINFGVDTKLRSASLFGSFTKRGNHSKPNLIQNWLGRCTVPA